MPIIRKQLIASEIYPSNIRYNTDTGNVQTLINDEWVDNPDGDPRHQTTLPPRITADTACDAAQSVVDALHGQIDSILEAIDNGGTVFLIAGIILSIFTFGLFAIFISLALTIGDAMLSAGTTAISAALTEPVYEMLRCILYCEMDEQGRITESGLEDIQAKITSEIGGLGATILNSMLALAGEGGINNLASLGTSSGDCSECECVEEWCYHFDFTTGEHSWVINNVPGYGDFGRYVASTGFLQSEDYTPVDALEVALTGWEGTMTKIQFEFDPGFTGSIPRLILFLGAYGLDIGTYTGGSPSTVQFLFPEGQEIIDGLSIDADPWAGGAQYADFCLTGVTIEGTGVNPFGVDNCE